jgi:hypothetical protein
MHSDNPDERSDCEQILEKKDLWALNEEELGIDDKFKKEMIINSDKLLSCKMANKLNSNKVLFNKLNHYFKDNIKMSLIWRRILIIATKDDLFYCIDIMNENIPSFIINDDHSVDLMIVQDLCDKQINDLYISYYHNFEGKHCYFFFVRNEYTVYWYDIKYGVMKKYNSQELIIDMCCGERHSILLTQSGKVYEYYVNEDERKKREKYIDFKLKSFNNSSFQNDKIKMISCGLGHSLALTESGRVFSWGSNGRGQLGIDVDRHSSEPIIIDLNDLRIQKISCGAQHSLLLSYDEDIYAFGCNCCGQIGNGTQENQRFPIKLELNNKFIDIASHPYYSISMSQSIDGIYYVWGWFEGKDVLSPQSTTYQLFEHILRADRIKNMKTFDKLVEFKDSFVKNGFYSKHFQEIKLLGRGSFGRVFKVKIKEDSRYYKDYKREGREYSAIKRTEFTSDVGKDDITREYLNYKIMTRNYSRNEYLVKHFDAWFEENQSGISLYIQTELCDHTLDDVIKEFDKDSHLKTNGTLTSVGYYIASQIFIQILQGVNHLHTQNPPLIHRDLKPQNILLKKDKAKGLCVKIADIGLAVIYKYSAQSHTLDRGTLKYMAPEVASNKNYDIRADIYSLGVIFQELFSLESNK